VVLCIPVDSSPLYEDPAEVRSTDRPCALDICNTALNPFVADPAQEWTNRTLISFERTVVNFLVLPGRLFSISEITEYTYFRLL